MSDLTSATPSWLVQGDNAWQLTAATLVAFQSIPGLALIYAGLVKKKWAINSMFMVFYAFAMVLICWVLWAYKVSLFWSSCLCVCTDSLLSSSVSESTCCHSWADQAQ